MPPETERRVAAARAARRRFRVSSPPRPLGVADVALFYEEEAERIVASLAAAVERHGFREYYDPMTGRGLAARGFGWSTLLVELL